MPFFVVYAPWKVHIYAQYAPSKVHIYVFSKASSFLLKVSFNLIFNNSQSFYQYLAFIAWLWKSILPRNKLAVNRK